MILIIILINRIPKSSQNIDGKILVLKYTISIFLSELFEE